MAELALPGAPSSAVWVDDCLYVTDRGHALMRVRFGGAAPRVEWRDHALLDRSALVA